jgi:hypothetical protein
MINTLENTISLPAHRLARIQEILASIGPSQRRVALKKLQKVMGELRSMAPAIPASIGLFSALQEALKTSDGKRVRLNSHAHTFLQDFHCLVEDVGSRPIAIDDFFPTDSRLPKGLAMLSRRASAVFTLCPCPVAI